MRGEPEASEPAHILDHLARIAGKGIWRARQTESHIVSALGANLDAVDTEHAGSIVRRRQLPGAVAVVGDDDELEPGTGGGGGNVVDGAGSVRCL